MVWRLPAAAIRVHRRPGRCRPRHRNQPSRHRCRPARPRRTALAGRRPVERTVAAPPRAPNAGQNAVTMASPPVATIPAALASVTGRSCAARIHRSSVLPAEHAVSWVKRVRPRVARKGRDRAQRSAMPAPPAATAARRMSAPMAPARLNVRRGPGIATESVIRVVVAAMPIAAAVVWFAVPTMFVMTARNRDSA